MASLSNSQVPLLRDAQHNSPTVPSDVMPDTPLEALNLNWDEHDLPERERTKHVHKLHPYLGKFIPQLVEIFLRKYFQRGQTVLDPFCGSGTTLVQANELGINAVGYDVSSFNVLLCRAKTAYYDQKKLRYEVIDILERTRLSSLAERQLRLWGAEQETKMLLTVTDDEYLQRWFAPQALYELLTYRHWIEHGDYEYKDLLKIILSRAARSARLTTHFDLDFPKKPQTGPYYCYKHSRICKPTEEAFKFLHRYSLDALRRIREFSMVRTDAWVSVIHGDAREAEFPPVDGVITSPPYVGLIDYHEQHAYAYHLLGLEDRRECEIGAAANGKGVKAQEEYKRQIAQVFRHAARAMPVGGHMIVVADDSANLYEEIAALSGFAVEYVIRRQVNRRTGRRANEFYESVFIWRKPS